MAAMNTLSGDSLRDENMAVRMLEEARSLATRTRTRYIEVVEAPPAFGLSDEFSEVEREAVSAGVVWGLQGDVFWVQRRKKEV